MQVNWREIPASRNSYAVLRAACETSGWHLHPVAYPEPDVTCYSLNSINHQQYRDEIPGRTTLPLLADHTRLPPGVMSLRMRITSSLGKENSPCLASSMILRPVDAGIFLVLQPVRGMNRYQAVSGLMHILHFLKSKAMSKSPVDAPFPVGIARPRRYSGIACDTVL